MPATNDEKEQNRAIIRSFYEGGGRDELASFADRLAEDFHVFVPSHLPWGGRSDKQNILVGSSFRLLRSSISAN